MRVASGARACVVAAAVLIAASGRPAAQRQPSLDEVRRRAAAYAVRYGESMASVIAKEDYTQQLLAGDRLVQQRQLTSEVALVQLSGSTEWQQFRDVLAVDGEAVAADPGRLERIFRAAPATVLGQVRALAADSARYNLGPLQRTFNTPTITLQFLHPAHQDRFRFTVRARTACDGQPCWELGLEERRTGTLIRTPRGRNVPIDARLWVAPGDGRLLRGRFTLADFLDAGQGRHPRAEIEVVWQLDPHIGEWVPATMRERYQGLPPPDGVAARTTVTLTGLAQYSNYRRFVVDYRIR